MDGMRILTIRGWDCRLEERQNQFSLAGEDGWKGRKRGGFFPFQLTVQPVLYGGVGLRSENIR